MVAKLRLFSAVSMTVCLAACASTDLGQREVNRTLTDKSSIEASYNLESQKLEDQIKQSGAIISDPALNRYLRDLTDEIIGDYDGELRVYALKAPVFNAGILPNGAMVIYSGLLLRAESEAELALVLGHEFGHYYEQHSLEQRAAAENATMANLLFTVGTLGYGGLVSILATSAQYSAFSREHEIQADEIGLERLASVDYDVRSAIKLWENLDSEKSQSTNKKVRKKNRRSAIFGTHPTSAKRLENLKAVAQSYNQQDPRIERETYRAQIRPFLQPWLQAELTQRDYGALFHLLDRLSADKADLGVINYMRGQTYSTRNETGDLTKAVAAYTASTKYADAPAAAWKNLGDLHTERGEIKKAREAFQSYLLKSPNAEDRQLIEYLIKKLGA